MMSESVSLPPGTSCGSFTDEGGFEYLSDQDIAAGRIPKSTNTNKITGNSLARLGQIRILKPIKQINEWVNYTLPFKSTAPFALAPLNYGLLQLAPRTTTLL